MSALVRRSRPEVPRSSQTSARRSLLAPIITGAMALGLMLIFAPALPSASAATTAAAPASATPGGVPATSPTCSGGWCAYPIDVPNDRYLVSVSCASSSFCVAVDNDGYYFVWSGGGWTAALKLDEGQYIASVSCPLGGSGFCAAVGYDPSTEAPDFFTFTGGVGGSWTQSSLPDNIPSQDELSSVSCYSPSVCAAVDFDSFVWNYNGSSWSGSQLDLETIPILGVSCYGSSSCMMVDEDSDTWLYDGSSWTENTTATGTLENEAGQINALSCSGSSGFECVAVDEDGDSWVYSDGNWDAADSYAINPSNEFAAISCPVASDGCDALDATGDVFPVSYSTQNGAKWSEDTGATGGGPTADSPNAIGCANPSFCMAVDQVGNVYLSGFAISTASLPAASWDSPYDAPLAAEGNTGAVTWSLANGSPPTGLHLSGAAITGTPTTVGQSSTFTIQATDAAHNVAVATLKITVGAAKTTTTLSLSPASGAVVYGHEQTQLFEVKVNAPGAPSGGMVKVMWKTTTLCSVTMGGGANPSEGSCSLAAAALAGGGTKPAAYSITATFGGDAPDLGPSAASSPVTVKVGQAKSSTTIKLSAARITYGKETSEHITLKVSPEYAGSLAGTLTIKAGKTTLCSIRVANSAGKPWSGTCTLTASKLPVGTYSGANSVVASYAGNIDFAASSAKATLTVVKA